MEEPAGFRQTINGLFAASNGLQNGKGKDLETRALFKGLVKAFESVSRKALFTVLRRFGHFRITW